MEWQFAGTYRKEWICEHGVGHYDPNLVKFTTHGCDGCCCRDDFPPFKKNREYYKVIKKSGIKVEAIDE